MTTHYPTSFAGAGFFTQQVLDPDDVPRRVWYCHDYELEFASIEAAEQWLWEYGLYERAEDLQTQVQDVLMTNNRGVLAEYGKPVNIDYCHWRAVREAS